MIHCLVAAMLMRCQRSVRCPGIAGDLCVSSGVRLCAPNSYTQKEIQPTWSSNHQKQRETNSKIYLYTADTENL